MIYIFHGIDDKSGVTMLAQSVAEGLAEAHSGGNVAFLALNGKPSLNYFKDGGKHVDALKSRLESRILSPQELMSHGGAGGGKNLFRVGGIDNEDEERYYLPELAGFMLDIAKQAFDFTVVDAGNRLDNGLAFGALSYSSERWFVLTQNEACLARWEKRRAVYGKLNIVPKGFVLNKYKDRDIYPLDYVAKRVGEDVPIHKLCWSRDGRQAEVERKTLARMDSAYKKGVNRIVGAILDGAPQMQEAQNRRVGWRGFISNVTWQKT